MKKILTVTFNPALDKSCTTQAIEPERKLRCDDVQRDPGGGGINVARAVRRLGGEATALWACGGATGSVMSGRLDEEQVAHEPFQIAEETRENLVVHDTSTDREFRFTLPGARLSEREIDGLCDRVMDLHADFVVASGSLPPGAPDDTFARLAKMLSERDDGRFIVDTSGGPLQAAAEAGVWLLKPNHHELCQLAGCDLEDDAAIRDAARHLLESGRAAVVLVTLGSAGALLVTAERVERIAAPTVPIRSRVGAGDSTVAGVVLALARERDLAEAARQGVAAGAAAVMTEGTELCRGDDANRLYRAMLEEHESAETTA
ncbi:MAG: 1-phosphofructokinase family hexose kinase [Planctomycetota bacterium]|nr:1-phosphofructokinase family hexose kinase [Planctomycetota bacterium]